MLTSLKTVTDCGFHVVSLISDNHAVNRSFFNFLFNNHHEPCVNPCDPSKKLYLLIDSIHTIKMSTIISRKGISLFFTRTVIFVLPNLVTKTMYNSESLSSLRLAHKLNERVFYPTNVQRTSACVLPMATFDDSTVAVLKYYVENGHYDWHPTAGFAQYICNLIKILNVRTSTVDVRRHDALELRVSSAWDARLEHLPGYASFFKQLRESKCACLTTETSTAVENLCRNKRSLVIHSLHEFSLCAYWTDNKRCFGISIRRYRQMSGGNYFISVKQVTENEKKIKLASLLKHSGITLEEDDETTGAFEIDLPDDACDSI